jgi:hypothetical protein
MLPIGQAYNTLAQHNRKDSAAMEIISFLGLVFLPGAYISVREHIFCIYVQDLCKWFPAP